VRFGSLFAGIGGFDLGLERAGMTCAWQVENDPYCNRVLAKHWPNVCRYGDIREIRWDTVEPVDVLCGGFPCQPVSVAGKQLGEADERWLWPEFARAIRDLRPRYVLVENVPGLLVRELGTVLGDLAALGYDAEWTVLRANDCGVPQRRPRVFIVAYPSRNGAFPVLHKDPFNAQRHRSWVDVARRDYADVDHEDHRARTLSVLGNGFRAEILDRERNGANDGVPYRVDRLRGLGNAIVPQCAEVIGRYVMDLERQRAARDRGTARTITLPKGGDI
jgi:DNA (cytosine-5)-methyltransferase 1